MKQNKNLSIAVLIDGDLEYFDNAFELASDSKPEVFLSLIGDALKKTMSKS